MKLALICRLLNIFQRIYSPLPLMHTPGATYSTYSDGWTTSGNLQK